MTTMDWTKTEFTRITDDALAFTVEAEAQAALPPKGAALLAGVVGRSWVGQRERKGRRAYVVLVELEHLLGPEHHLFVKTLPTDA